jgi:hypothetical protein
MTKALRLIPRRLLIFGALPDYAAAMTRAACVIAVKVPNRHTAPATNTSNWWYAKDRSASRRHDR